MEEHNFLERTYYDVFLYVYQWSFLNREEIRTAHDLVYAVGWFGVISRPALERIFRYRINEVTPLYYLPNTYSWRYLFRCLWAYALNIFGRMLWLD